MTDQQPKLKSSTHYNLWGFIKTIVIWAIVVTVIDKILTYVGWDKWDKFETSASEIDSVMLLKVKRISPISLFVALRSKEVVYITDTAKKNEVKRYNRSLWQGNIKAEYALGMQKFYTPKPQTNWDKIKAWTLGFWYNDNKGGNWFGRIFLLFVFIIALPLTSPARNSKSFKWGSSLYIINIILALCYLTLFFMALYFIIKFILVIAGAVVALFSSLAMMGGVAKSLAEELKFETMVHLKKTVKV